MRSEGAIFQLAQSNQMNWAQQAKLLFNTPKPEHFTNYRHCCECAEHDQTLLTFDIDSIGLEQLGNPGWDPLCFSSPEGLIYYMPALVRITVNTVDSLQESYLDQLLFHLIKDGPGNRLVCACNEEQREFIAQFLEHLITNHVESINDICAADEILRAHEIWS